MHHDCTLSSVSFCVHVPRAIHEPVAEPLHFTMEPLSGTLGIADRHEAKTPSEESMRELLAAEKMRSCRSSLCVCPADRILQSLDRTAVHRCRSDVSGTHLAR